MDVDESELMDMKNDPLLSADFDILDYFNEHYKDEKSLENVAIEIQK